MENENYELEVLNDNVDLDDITSESSSSGLLTGSVGLLLGIAGTLMFQKGARKIKEMRTARKTEEVVDKDCNGTEDVIVEGEIVEVAESHKK